MQQQPPTQGVQEHEMGEEEEELTLKRPKMSCRAGENVFLIPGNFVPVHCSESLQAATCVGNFFSPAITRKVPFIRENLVENSAFH